jgi:signal transduction histidine kinase
MSSFKSVHTTLATRVMMRLGWAAAAVIVGNMIYAAGHNLFDTNHITENIVRTESREIAHSADRALQDHTWKSGDPLPAYDGDAGFRLIEANGHVAGQWEGDVVARAGALEPYDARTAIFQVSRVKLDGKTYIWGVARHQIAGKDMLVEVAMPADTTRTTWRALSDEMSLHVWVPLLPSALLFLLLAHRSVHSGLAPLSNAIKAIQGSEVARGRPPKLAGDRLTSEVGGFLAEVEAAFSKHSSMLRAQQEFVGRVAHELRTPLTVMTLDLAAIDDPKARAIERDVHGLSEKITKMLAWARMDLAGQRPDEPVDLVAIAEDTERGLRRLGQEREVTIEIVSEGDAVTSGDVFSVKEAVRNMIENAIKHTPVGSRVVVACGPGPRIGVADNGKGFPKVDRPLLLQPFWKGDVNTDGAGLGLALVKRVADSHGARLRFGTSRDGGAEISLRFRSTQSAGVIDTRAEQDDVVAAAPVIAL